MHIKIQYNTRLAFVAANTHDTIQYDTIRYDTIRYDTIRYDTIRYDTIRYDMYCSRCQLDLLGGTQYCSRCQVGGLEAQADQLGGTD